MTNLEKVDTPFSSNKPYLFRAIYDWIVDNEGTPYVLVDAKVSDVMVPLQFVKDGQIVLNISPVAIDNWFSDNKGISFSARFSGKSENIFVPMEGVLAIYAQENGAGMAFEADEKKPELSDDESEALQSEIAPPNKKNSHLKVIK